MTGALLRLLRAREASMVDQGVELAASLADPQLFDDLLAGVSYGAFSSAARFRDRDPRWIFRPNALFTGSRQHQPWLDRALIGLIALAPPESAVAAQLRAEVWELWVQGAEDQEMPIDLGVLTRFPGLESLQIHHARPLTGVHRLGRLPRLQKLWLHACALPRGLAGLEAPALRELGLIGVALDSLDGIGGAPELESLRLHGAGPCDLAGLAGLERLVELSVSGVEGRLPRLIRQGRLEALHLQGLAEAPDLAGLPALRRLWLADVPIPDLRRLGDLSALEELHLAASPGGEAAGLARPWFGEGPFGEPSGEKLGRLALLEIEADHLAEIGGLAGLPALRELELRTKRALSPGSLAELAGLRRLWLGSPAQETLTALPPDLEELSIHAPALRALPPLPAGLRRLFLPGCASLEALDLSGLARLEQVSVDGCSGLAAIRGAADLARLQTLDLRGTHTLREAPELDGLAELRGVAIEGCALSRHNFSAPIRVLLSSDPMADLESMRRAPPRATIRRRTDEGGFQALLKRLRVRDLSGIDAAIEDLSASLEGAPDRAIWVERLLAGAEPTHRPSTWSRRDGVVLAPGPLLRGSRNDGPYREHATRALLSVAPPASAEAARLRGAIHRLRVSGHVTLRRDPDAPVDLRPLAALPGLIALSVERACPLIGAEVLARLPLQGLELAGCEGLAALPDLPPGLRQLRLESMVGLQRIERLEGLAALEELELDRLELPDLRPLAALPQLRRLRLRHMPGQERLDALAGCAALEELELVAIPARDLSPLARLPRLRRLTLDGCPAIQDIQPLAGLSLTHLQLYRLYRLKDLRPLSRIYSLQAVRTDGQCGAAPPGLPLITTDGGDA